MNQQEMNQQDLINISKVLRSANKRPYDRESLTEIYAVVKSANSGYPALIKDHYFDIIDYLAVLKGDQFAKICALTEPDQVKIISALFVDINADKIAKLTPADIAGKINTELAREGVAVKVSPSPEIVKVISHIKVLETIKRAVRLVNIYDAALEISSYSKQYIPMSADDIKKDLTFLEDVIRDTKTFLADESKAQKIATDYLASRGYPVVALQGKRAGDLLRILEHHYLAALGVVAIKLEKPTANIQNPNSILDSIALFLLDQEDLQATD